MEPGEITLVYDERGWWKYVVTKLPTTGKGGA